MDEMNVAQNAGVQEASSRGENGQDCPEPFGADKLAMNGVELTQSSSMVILKAACSFYNLSVSISKTKCYRKLVHYLKQMELETATRAVNNYERGHRGDPISMRQLIGLQPSKEEITT